MQEITSVRTVLFRILFAILEMIVGFLSKKLNNIILLYLIDMWYNPTLALVSPINAKIFPRKCIKDNPRENNLQLYLRFNEGNGRTTFDYSEYGRHGVIYDASWGKNDVDRGLWFNGVNSYVRTPSFTLSGTSISIVAWVKCAKYDKLQTIVNKEKQSSSQGYIFIYRISNSNAIAFQFTTGTGVQTLTFGNFFTGYDDQYLFVAVTCDYENKILNVYRNGQLYEPRNVADSMIFPSTSSACYIGSYQWNMHFFKGVIDEVRLYNRLLTNQEIRMIYENEKDNYR